VGRQVGDAAGELSPIAVGNVPGENLELRLPEPRCVDREGDALAERIGLLLQAETGRCSSRRGGEQGAESEQEAEERVERGERTERGGGWTHPSTPFSLSPFFFAPLFPPRLFPIARFSPPLRGP